MENRFKKLTSVVCTGALLGGLTSIGAVPSQANLDDSHKTYPLENTENITIPPGLYASSRNMVVKFDDPTQIGGPVTIWAQTSLSESRPGDGGWSGNFGIGPAGPRGENALVGQPCCGGPLKVYRLTEGTHHVEEVGETVSAGGRPYGGASVSQDGKFWVGTNLQGPAETRLTKFDPRTGSSEVNDGSMVSTLPKDPIWNAGGVVAPDYAFDTKNDMYGLVARGRQVWIYKYNLERFPTVTVTPVIQVKGPAARASIDNYGFAWYNGFWYAGNGNGYLYQIDPQTGDSKNTGQVTGSNGRGKWKIYDLASADLELD